MLEIVSNGGNQIDRILNTTLSRLKTMAESETVFGDPYTTPDGTTVIPVSKITVGYVAGGGEYEKQPGKKKKKEEEFPFAGGSGACVSMTPVGFLVGTGDNMRLVSVNGGSPLDKVMEMTVDFMNRLKH